MKKLHDLYDFIKKNCIAIIHAKGYRIVNKKPRNSSLSLTSIAKQKPGHEAVFKAQQGDDFISKSKYFTVQVDAKPGINHLREALNWLVKEAVSLNRTPLVFVPQFDNCHNFDIDVHATWDKYLDLDNFILSSDQLAAPVAIKAVMADQIAGLGSLSVLKVERDYIITEQDNATYDLIIRHNKTGLEIPGIHQGIRGLPDYTVRLQPSQRVLDIFRQVSAQIPSYCAIHVRRGDMLRMVAELPHLDQDTQPGHIKDVIASVMPLGAPVYILTNERDKSFFNPIKDSYAVLQYFDFPELNALVSGDQPDNFLLFEIEKLLFDNAQTKIYTFTHPEGGQRISLSSHLGWA